MVMGLVRGFVRGLSCVVGGDHAWGISSSGCCGAFTSLRHGGFLPKITSQTAHHARFLEGQPRV